MNTKVDKGQYYTKVDHGRQDYRPLSSSISLYILLSSSILILVIFNLFLGSVRIPFTEVCRILLGDDSNVIATNIIFSSRLPQALTAIVAGAGLAVSGLQMQTVFRNPLAGRLLLQAADILHKTTNPDQNHP